MSDLAFASGYSAEAYALGMQYLRRARRPRVAQVATKADFRLLAVSAAGFCVFLSVYATQALLPLLAKVFHASELSASLTVTATAIAVAVAAPAVGLLAERVGRKIVIVAAIFLLAIPTFLAATSATLNALIGWRFAQGLIMPGIIAVTMAYVAEEWPANRVGAAMSAYITGNVLGGVVGRLLTGYLGGRFGWHTSFAALGLLDLAGGIVVLKTLPPSRHLSLSPNWATSLRDMSRHLLNRPLLYSYVVGFNILLTLVATFTYITFRLAGAPFNLGPAGLGSLFLVYLVGVIVTPIGGRFIDRIGQPKAVLAAIVLTAAGLLLTMLPSLAPVVVGLGLACSGIFVCQAATASYMGLVAGKSRASATGLYATCYYAGGAAGAFVPGLFWHIGHWPATVAFLFAILAVTAAVVRFAWTRPTTSVT